MQYILVCGPNIEWITFAAPTKMTSIVGKHVLGMANGEWRMANGEWFHSSFTTRHSPLKKERCQRGRSSTLGKRVY